MKLDTEKFNTVKELSEIQQNVALGRATLLKLKETTEEYMVVREKEAEGRVIKVLKESRTALDETTKNHKELSGYNIELQAYAIELNKSAIDITALFEDFGKKMDEADKKLEEGRISVAEVLRDAKIERIQVIEDRKILKLERGKIRDEMILLKDRRQLL